MMYKKEIAILLPNKEDYTKNNAAAASIWVKDFNGGELYKKTIILIGDSHMQTLEGSLLDFSNKNNFIIQCGIFLY